MKNIRTDLEFIGWGLVGDPQYGIFVAGPTPRKTIDVTGYSDSDYWDGDGFKGEDIYGVVPIYRDRKTCEQFPAAAKRYEYLS